MCCQTAWDDFEKIINTLSGPLEKQRANDLRSKLTILPDDVEGKKKVFTCFLKHSIIVVEIICGIRG